MPLQCTILNIPLPEGQGEPMRADQDYQVLRAIIQRCKRPELDKLIKLTNLPRGGLKQDLQLRLLSYLEQGPSDAFLGALNGLQRTNNFPDSVLIDPTARLRYIAALQTAAAAASNTSSREPQTSVCGDPLFSYSQTFTSNRTDSEMTRYTPSAGSYSSAVEDSHHSSHNKPGVTPSVWEAWAAANKLSTANRIDCTAASVSSVQVGAAVVSKKSSPSSQKPHTNSVNSSHAVPYYLTPGHSGPLISLAGTDGAFRLPGTLSGFRFEESPFFKEIDVLLEPQVLIPAHIGFATGRRSYDRSLALRFTADQAETITYHCRRTSDDRMEYGVQVIMRFARLDPDFCKLLTEAYGTVSQRNSRIQQQQQGHVQPTPLYPSDDVLPVHLLVQVNGRPVQLPPLLPSNRPGMDGRRNPRPINITQFLRVSPAVPNYIKLTWTHDYAAFTYNLVGIYLMHKRSPQHLCSLLQSVAFCNADKMKSELIRKLQPKADHNKSVDSSGDLIANDECGDDDDDIVMPNTLPVQLLCPLSKCRIEVPVRGRDCRHVQCYDATTYLIINERKPSWKCPVCDQKARYDDLIVDGLLMEVLSSKKSHDVDEVVFHDDGSWSTENDEDISGAFGNESSNPLPSAPMSSPNGARQHCGSTAFATTESDSVGSSTLSVGQSFSASSPSGSANSAIFNGPLGNMVSNSPMRTPSAASCPAVGCHSEVANDGIPTGRPFTTPTVTVTPSTINSATGTTSHCDSGEVVTIDLTSSDDETADDDQEHMGQASSPVNRRLRTCCAATSAVPTVSSLPRTSTFPPPLRVSSCASPHQIINQSSVSSTFSLAPTNIGSAYETVKPIPSSVQSDRKYPVGSNHSGTNVTSASSKSSSPVAPKPDTHYMDFRSVHPAFYSPSSAASSCASFPTADITAHAQHGSVPLTLDSRKRGHQSSPNTLSEMETLHHTSLRSISRLIPTGTDRTNSPEQWDVRNTAAKFARTVPQTNSPHSIAFSQTMPPNNRIIPPYFVDSSLSSMSSTAGRFPDPTPLFINRTSAPDQPSDLYHGQCSAFRPAAANSSVISSFGRPGANELHHNNRPFCEVFDNQVTNNPPSFNSFLRNHSQLSNRFAPNVNVQNYMVMGRNYDAFDQQSASPSSNRCRRNEYDPSFPATDSRRAYYP
ncbi:unnamed protein product [Calicophoron daubneyi]|uniref:Uncharacterized protein n=1 Tax=Calicophoron daubneyi TaxID=300641 RepID=A0AAV2TL36_CALDB